MKLPSNSSYINYRQVIFNLTTTLKRLQYLSQKLNFTDLVELSSDVLNRIESNSFSIAVVGAFNRGKSTFINALLGQEILPSDILATTATLSHITYRATPGAKICFKDGREQQIELDQLSDYITKLTSISEDTAKQIKEAVVYYPVPYCQNNVKIIDTPGLDDHADMTAITYEVISKCDLVIMVISAISPFSITEGDFLINELLSKGVSRVLLVVNQIDALSNLEEVNQIINLIKNRVESSILEWAKLQLDPQESLRKIGKIQILGISALQALQAKSTKNIPLLAQSCFVNFEYALKTLLNQERGLIQLPIFTNRVINCATEILKSIANQETELEQSQVKLKQLSQKINEQIYTLRYKKNENITSVSHTFLTLKQQKNTLCYQIKNKIKQAAINEIESNNINASEQSNFASQIFKVIQNIINDFAREIQTKTRQALSIALVNIRDFAKLFYQGILQIKKEVVDLGMDTTIFNKIMNIVPSIYQNCEQVSQENVGALPPLFPSSSDIFVFEEKTSGVIGTGAGAALGFFVGGPLGAAIGAAVGAGVSNSVNTNKFKEKYQSQVIAVIENQLHSTKIDQIVDDYIYHACSQIEKLQASFSREINLLLDESQNLLAEFYGNQEFKLVVKYQEIRQMQVEIQQIISYAQNISEQLN
ncbi:dynamin family protein [Nostoc sp. UHCC 0302]|uniref:dynamin family protein n=1 Tax=Nostoc sp. UHCC 0302 TaxID=3134896 RepID=UPI00311CDB44